jgi:hypothetical protein
MLLLRQGRGTPHGSGKDFPDSPSSLRFVEGHCETRLGYVIKRSIHSVVFDQNG